MIDVHMGDDQGPHPVKRKLDRQIARIRAPAGIFSALEQALNEARLVQSESSVMLQMWLIP